MQTEKHNGLIVRPSVYGNNHIAFGGYDQDAYLWHTSVEHDGVRLYKAKGRRLIVAVKDEVIIDGEIWDMYGNEYRYAQQDIENRWA